MLAAHFLDLFSAEMGLTPPALTPQALSDLTAHPFPGNVRELKNVMERALILSAGRPIDRSHLQLLTTSAILPKPSIPPQSPTTAGSEPSPSTAPVSLTNLPLNLEAAEQALIQRALEQTHGNVAEAARLLNINRSRIYRKFPQAGKV